MSRRLETADEFLQFLLAINYMRTSQPELAEIEASVCGLSDRWLCNERHTKPLAARREYIACCTWTDERAAA